MDILGHEHSFPFFPLYKDVIDFSGFFKENCVYDPTLLVAYGATMGRKLISMATENPHDDQNWTHFYATTGNWIPEPEDGNWMAGLWEMSRCMHRAILAFAKDFALRLADVLLGIGKHVHQLTNAFRLSHGESLGGGSLAATWKAYVCAKSCNNSRCRRPMV